MRYISEDIQRLEKELENLGIRVSEFRKELNIRSQNYNNWKQRGISAAMIPIIAKRINKSEEWVRSGELKGVSEPAPSYLTDNGVTAPLVQWSNINSYIHSGDKGLIEQQYPCPIPHGIGTFITIANGELMKNNITDGEWLFIDPTETPTPGKKVVAKISNGSEPILRTYVTDGDQAYLQTSNPDWPAPIIEITDEIIIIGTVIFRGRPA